MSLTAVKLCQKILYFLETFFHCKWVLDNDTKRTSFYILKGFLHNYNRLKDPIVWTRDEDTKDLISIHLTAKGSNNL